MDGAAWGAGRSGLQFRAWIDYISGALGVDRLREQAPRILQQALDPLTRIFRLELPSYQEGTPMSAWYFALAGLLKNSGIKNELLHDMPFPEARNRIIQRKFAGTA